MSSINRAHAILIREMEILQAQELPKFPILNRVLRAYCIDVKQARKLFRSLRKLQIVIWMEYDYIWKDYSEIAITNFLSKQTISDLILKNIKNILGDELSDQSLMKMKACIAFDFKKFYCHSLSRILMRLTSLKTEYQSEDLIIVSTIDGRLCAIDYFLGLIVWRFKPGTPLILSSRPQQNCTIGKILNIIPSLNGSLYKLGTDFVPKPLQISMEQLFSSCPSIDDIIITEYEINLKKEVHSSDIENDSDVTLSAIHSIKLSASKGIIRRQLSSLLGYFWEIKLRSPIANVWILEKKRLQKLDLFSSLLTIDLNNKLIHPTFYYGSMGDCPYILESSQMKTQKFDETNFEKNLNVEETQFLFSIMVEGCKPSDVGLYVCLEKNSLSSAHIDKSPSVIEDISKNIKDEKYNSEFFNTFEYIKVLGNGAFGSVFEARHRHSNCTYAIKRIDKKEYELDQIVREVQAQANLDHENLVRYYHSWLEEPPLNWDDPLESELESAESSFDSSQPGSYPTSYESSNKAYFYIQMELCKGGNLRDWLNKYNKFEERITNYISYFKQIVNGVEYIHKQGFIHRDLKPENIFIFTNDHIKIGDFGLTTNIIDPLFIDSIDLKMTKKSEHTLNVGTGFYIAPEQKVKTTYDNKVDIWALGIILVELLCVFKTGVERIKVLEKLHIGTFSPELIDTFPDVYELLRLMLLHDPTKRPTTFGVRAHAPINDKNVNEHFYYRMPSKFENDI